MLVGKIGDWFLELLKQIQSLRKLSLTRFGFHFWAFFGTGGESLRQSVM